MSLQRTPLILSVAILAVGGMVLMRLPAQTTSSGGTTVADSPPTISLEVLPHEGFTGQPVFYLGHSVYFQAIIKDDKPPLSSIVVTRSPVKYDWGTTIDLSFLCSNRTECWYSDKNGITVNTGKNFVTVTAKDSAGQVSTKTVEFTVVACTADAECPGNAYWQGYSYCGSENGSLPLHVMMKRYTPACRDGACGGEVKPSLKQACTSGQVCTMVGVEATCLGGNEVPVSSSSLSPRSASASTLPVSSLSTSPTVSSEGQTIAPSGSPSTSTPSVTAPLVSPVPASPIIPSAVPPAVHPAPPSNLPRVQTGSSVMQKKVSKAKIQALKKQQQALRKALRSLERSLLRKKNVAALSQIADLRDELADLDLRDPSVVETLRSLREEINDLRSAVIKKVKRGG